MAQITGRDYDVIKKAFYGGLVDTYNIKGDNLHYYDVNSLYPYAMLQDMPVGVPRYIKGAID